VPRISGSKAKEGVDRLSFLASLNQVIPVGKIRNPEADRFVNSFKRLKNELAQTLFTYFNESVFDQKLPADLPILWNKRLLKTAGYCKYKKTTSTCAGIKTTGHNCVVELSEKILDNAERTRDTLLHELCHAVVWIVHGVNEGHGKFWKFYAKKATFIHRDIPLVTRCHSYEIATKFLYVCLGCGYTIGRHSKSLDTQRKICGKCHGTFECRKNSEIGTPAGSRNGSQAGSATSLSSAPSTPRTPNKFALFVKENFATAKKENAGMSHGEIMKLLGQDFKDRMKV